MSLLLAIHSSDGGQVGEKFADSSFEAFSIRLASLKHLAGNLKFLAQFADVSQRFANSAAVLVGHVRRK